MTNDEMKKKLLRIAALSERVNEMTLVVEDLADALARLANIDWDGPEGSIIRGGVHQAVINVTREMREDTDEAQATVECILDELKEAEERK